MALRVLILWFYAPLPAALVEWLREILPGKTTAELYMAIGCQKHAKTESYREYLVYLQGCNEQFIGSAGYSWNGDVGVYVAGF